MSKFHNFPDCYKFLDFPEEGNPVITIIIIMLIIN